MARRTGIGERLANPLAKYRTYAYHHILVACDSTQTAKSLSTALESSPEKFKAISVGENEPVQANTVPNGSGGYVVLCNGLNSARFNIVEVKWETVIDGSYSLDDSTVVTTSGEIGSMVIHEPIGVGFFNALAYTCDALGTEPSGIAFLLKTIFVGYTDDGDNYEYIFNVRPTLFMLRDIQCEFELTGTTYHIEIVGMADGYAKMPQINNIGSSVTLNLEKSNCTLADALKSLETQINETYKASIQKAINSARNNGCEALQLENYRQVVYKIEVCEAYQNARYVVDNPLDNTSTRGDGDFTFAGGEKGTIEILINDIIGACTEVQKDLKGTTQQNGIISNFIPSISSNVESDNDNLLVTYTVHRFKGQGESFEIPEGAIPSLPEETIDGVQVVEILEGGNKRLANGDIITADGGTRTRGSKDSIERAQQIIQNRENAIEKAAVALKENAARARQDEIDLLSNLANSKKTIIYDYIFTGLNTDIQDLQMKMDIGLSFLQTLTIQKTMADPLETVNNHTGASTGKGAAGNVTKFNKNNTIRPKSILFHNPESRDVYARHTKNEGSTLTYRSQLSNHAGYKSIEIVVNITGNPDLIAGTDPTIKTVDGNTRWNNVPQFCKINIKYPDGNYPDGEYNFVDFWYTGLYRILQIENVFSDGLFTQNLKLVSLPVENPYNTKAEEVIDCFTSRPVSAGPKVEPVITTDNIKIKDDIVTAGAPIPTSSELIKKTTGGTGLISELKNEAPTEVPSELLTPPPPVNTSQSIMFVNKQTAGDRIKTYNTVGTIT